MDSASKLVRCPAPLPETAPDPMLVRMLEVAPPEEGEGENRGTTASTKEAFEEGGIENPSFQGEKRTASENPEAKAPKRGKRSSPEGASSGEAPAAQSPLKNQPSNESYVEKREFYNKGHPICASEDNSSFYLVVRISVLRK